MGDSAINGSGLVYRTAKFFNNKDLSDLEFIVKDKSGTTTFYAHKLILSMASEEFAHLVMKNGSTGKMRILDFGPNIVYLTLRYLYTDELDLTNIQEAMDVCRLASKFGIKDLVELCKNYIGLDRITEDKIFLLYDIALKDENLKDLLQKCRDLIRRKTAELFDSLQFCNATVEVLKDILDQNYLAVYKEIHIINAVLRWCRQDCARKGRPTEPVCIRDSISPLLPYLRFLTLSPDEFFMFVEENSIFTSSESVALTRKIIEPNSNCKIPTGFCTNINQREKINANGFKPDAVRNASLKSNGNVAVTSQRLNLKDPVRSEINNEPLWAIQRPQKEISTSPVLDMPPSTPTYSFPQKGMLNVNMNSNRLQKEVSTPPVSDMSPSTPTYSFPQKGMLNESMNSKQWFPFTAETPKKPILKIIPNANVPAKKLFDFPLLEMQRGMSSVSKRDVICSAELRVSKGKIVIYGVDLRILSLPQSPDETIRVGLSISGDCPTTDSNSLVKLRNDVISLPFSEALSLYSTNSAKIEITIEDLKLNRCSVCRQQTHELNMGTNFTTVINLRSNQSTEADGFLFLISRIIYS